jgi:peptidoglycan-associated lipoprotein
MALGQRRAQSIYESMTILGVDSSRMETLTYGEENPASSGHNESAWQENRRVEIIY